jgi:hypothetical protein
MSQADMITAITNSIQTEANLILLLQSQIAASLSFMTQDQLQAICNVLNIDTSGSGT